MLRAGECIWGEWVDTWVHRKVLKNSPGSAMLK